MQEENWLIANGFICDGWRFLNPLGRGGMGEVYAVEEQATGLRFAMKLNRAPFTVSGAHPIGLQA